MKNLINEAIDEWISSGEYQYTNATYYLKKRLSNIWISVKDRLPEKSVPVLICANGHRVTAYYDKVKKVFRLTEDEDLYYLANYVTHWMPLPDPPKESEAATLTTDIEEFYKEAMKSSGRWNEPPESEGS